jgi:lipopolysaccharide/colanic/teichoic acid biosynthesis glycosyltransferase
VAGSESHLAGLLVDTAFPAGCTAPFVLFSEVGAVNYVASLAALVLTILMGYALRSSIYRKTPVQAYRRAFLVAVGLMWWAWFWLHHNYNTVLQAALLILVGSFVGGLLASAATTGLVENNAPPSPAVRQRVLAYHASSGQPPLQPRFKRVFDVAGALVGLLVTLPLWPLITFLIWIEEPGPVFFTKNSVGKGGVTFRQLKFRSMKYGAEVLTGPVPSAPDDSRTLRVGRWLRRWHLDELPELINVLAGTMSLVGPRPLRTVVVRAHLEEVPGYAERHLVRPGIACIAQIEKYYISPAERLEKDRAYIRHASVAFDIRLLGRAVITTLRGDRLDDMPTESEHWRPDPLEASPDPVDGRTSAAGVLQERDTRRVRRMGRRSRAKSGSPNPVSSARARQGSG